MSKRDKQILEYASYSLEEMVDIITDLEKEKEDEIEELKEEHSSEVQQLQERIEDLENDLIDCNSPLE